MPRPPTPRYCTCGTRLAADHTGTSCAACLHRNRQLAASPPDLPATFWQTDQMHDAFAAQHIGLVSLAYRLHPHHYGTISQERLGNWLGLTQAQVSRIESGPPVRDLDRLAHWATRLKLPAPLLWFDLPGQRRTAFPARAAASAVPSSATLATGRWPGKAVALPTVPASLDTIRWATAAFRAADRQLGGGALYPVVARYLHTDVFPQLADFAHQPAAFAAAAALSDMAGWLAYDDRQLKRAGLHFVQALNLATAANHPVLRAQTLASQSHLALEHGRAAEAVALAAAGLALVPNRSGRAALRARLQAMTARGSALRGDEAACWAALRAAEDEARRVEAVPHDWLSPFDEAALAAEAAICHRDLGHLATAERHAEQVLALRTPDRLRSRSFAHLTLASIHLRQGDLESTTAAAGQVLDVAPQLASKRVVRQVLALGRRLAQSHGGAAPAMVFLERLRATLPQPRPRPAGAP